MALISELNKLNYLSKNGIKLVDCPLEGDLLKNIIDNREEFLKKTKEIEKYFEEYGEEYGKLTIGLYPSQFYFLKYEDLDKIIKVADKIFIIDDCNFKKKIGGVKDK